MYEDNTAAISLAKNPAGSQKRIRHFGIEWAHFKQAVELGEVELVHVSTNEQPADMLTKPLDTKKYAYFRDMVMGSAELQNHFIHSVKAVRCLVDDSRAI